MLENDPDSSTPMESSASGEPLTPRKTLFRIGPAIVVAAVVLGPGSIVTASRVGCEYGLSLLWVVPVAGVLMIGMTTAAMLIGVSKRETLCQSVANAFGRPAAWVVGISLMIAITLFQASNNNAMLMAVGGLIGKDSMSGFSSLAKSGWLLLFNFGIIGILIAGRRDLYRWIERAMMGLVGMMVLSFGLSMLASSPSIVDIAWGLIPSSPESSLSASNALEPSASPDADAVSMSAISWMSVGALIATTFSVAGAFYQSYQVREKGWTVAQTRLGIIDSVFGISALAVITSMILITAATALHGRIAPSELTDASVVAMSLEPLFGKWASIVFALGILAGAVSSFLVNALIGGVVFCDALGWGCKMQSNQVRFATIAALLLGWAIASTVSLTGIDLVSFIVVAQSLTVLCFPILAAVLVWQLHSLERAPMILKILVWCGLLVVVGLATRTVWNLVG